MLQLTNALEDYEVVFLAAFVGIDMDGAMVGLGGQWPPLIFFFKYY